MTIPRPEARYLYTEDPELESEEGHAELNQEAWGLRGTSGRCYPYSSEFFFSRSVNKSIYRGFMITLQPPIGRGCMVIIIIIITGIALLITLKLPYQNDSRSPDNGIINVVGVKVEDPQKATLKMLSSPKKSSFKY